MTLCDHHEGIILLHGNHCEYLASAMGTFFEERKEERRVETRCGSASHSLSSDHGGEMPPECAVQI